MALILPTRLGFFARLILLQFDCVLLAISLEIHVKAAHNQTADTSS
jgi:hypothetical protein